MQPPSAGFSGARSELSGEKAQKMKPESDAGALAGGVYV